MVGSYGCGMVSKYHGDSWSSLESGLLCFFPGRLGNHERLGHVVLECVGRCVAIQWGCIGLQNKKSSDR